MVGVLVLLTALAGCSSDGKPRADDGPGSTLVTVDGGSPGADGVALTVEVAPGKGAIVGSIVDDLTFPVEGANVAVLDTDFAATSNATGGFRFLDLAPGRYEVRVDHRDYRSVQEPVTVSADKATGVQVVLIPKSLASGGYREHIHDRWGGKDRLAAIDRAFDWHEPYDDPSPTGDVQGRAMDMQTQVNSHHCVFANGDGVWRVNRLVWFDDPHMLVYPGTQRLEVTLDWSEDAWPLEGLAFAWATAAGPFYNVSGLLQPGEVFTIPVTPGDWDSSHQQFSLWDFWVCTDDKTPGQQDRSVPFNGDVSVKLDLVRMEGPIPPERAHPYFWGNDTVRPVVNGTEKRFGGANPPSGQAQTSRSPFGSQFVVRPDEGLIVPPGTSELLAMLQWSVDLPVPGDAWSLTYRPANVYRFDARTPAELLKAELVEEHAGGATYRIPLEPGMADEYYQSVSSWLFFLNVKGKEADSGWTNPCGVCQQTVTTIVTAHRDPTFLET